MKVSRLELATKYLIDLMRAYGHRPITVRVNMDGESVEIMARNFVKRQLTKVGILFPYTVYRGKQGKYTEIKQQTRQ